MRWPRAATAPPLEVPLPADAEYVLPFFTWTPDSNHALYITVNRDHTELTLNMWTPQSGEVRTLITETGPVLDQRGPLCGPGLPRRADGQARQFLWLSERDGFMHLYLYTAGGQARPAVDPGRLDDRHLGLEPAHPGPPGPRGPGGTHGRISSPRKPARWSGRSTASTSPAASSSRSRREPGFHLRRCPATASTWWTSSPTSTRRRSRGSCRRTASGASVLGRSRRARA